MRRGATSTARWARWAWLATALLGGAASASAQGEKPKVPLDDVNPRAPTTPLKIELTPYWCPLCAKEGLIKPEQRTIEMLRKPVETISQQLEIKDDWLAIETPHFKIYSTLRGTLSKYADSVFCKFDLERLKTIQPKIQFSPEGAKLDAHQRIHLYHVRLERLYAHFSALTGNTKPNLGMPLPYDIFLFNDYGEHHAFCDRYTGGRSDKSGVQYHYMEGMDEKLPDLMLFTTSESMVAQNMGKGDGILANHVFHNVAHILMDGYNGYFRETPAWIEEGLGHYYERRENPRWNNFCWAEGKPPTDFTRPDWETTIFSIVRRERDTPLSQWCEKLQPGELSATENGFTWGIVKWLIDTEPVRFSKMIEKMDDQKLNWSSAQMIDEGFGVTPSVLYQRWREWVLKNWAGQ